MNWTFAFLGRSQLDLDFPGIPTILLDSFSDPGQRISGCLAVGPGVARRIHKIICSCITNVNGHGRWIHRVVSVVRQEHGDSISIRKIGRVPVGGAAIAVAGY